jgi:L-fuculokinase
MHELKRQASRVTPNEAVVVLDVGKTNVKVSALAGDGSQVESFPNETRLDGPYPHCDVEAIFGFALDAMARFAKKNVIKSIVTTTHGATAALMRGDSLALPVLDYEHPAPETEVTDYEEAARRFDETGSPRLPQGLNLGRQLAWLERQHPAEFEHATDLLLYPQYFGFRFSGVKAGEVTSLGCHTDLWAPRQKRPSSFATSRGYARLLPPMRSAWETLGTLRLEPARRAIAAARDQDAAVVGHAAALSGAGGGGRVADQAAALRDGIAPLTRARSTRGRTAGQRHAAAVRHRAAVASAQGESATAFRQN